LLRGDLELTYGPAWGTSDGLRKTRLSSDTPFTMPVGIWHSFENQKDSESSMLITANRWFNPEKPDTINCEL
jgi:dTDP-4-dehydrorhamnose 3,5-epimerase-like enzyme